MDLKETEALLIAQYGPRNVWVCNCCSPVKEHPFIVSKICPERQCEVFNVWCGGKLRSDSWFDRLEPFQEYINRFNTLSYKPSLSAPNMTMLVVNGEWEKKTYSVFDFSEGKFLFEGWYDFIRVVRKCGEPFGFILIKDGLTNFIKCEKNPSFLFRGWLTDSLMASNDSNLFCGKYLIKNTRRGNGIFDYDSNLVDVETGKTMFEMQFGDFKVYDQFIVGERPRPLHEAVGDPWIGRGQWDTTLFDWDCRVKIPEFRGSISVCRDYILKIDEGNELITSATYSVYNKKVELLADGIVGITRLNFILETLGLS